MRTGGFLFSMERKECKTGGRPLRIKGCLVIPRDALFAPFLSEARRYQIA